MAFSETQQNDRPVGSDSAFCDPVTTTSTPQSSILNSHAPTLEMPSTMSSAGWPAASIARRTPAMSEVTPVVVSLCTTHTALISPLVSALSAASMRASEPFMGTLLTKRTFYIQAPYVGNQDFDPLQLHKRFGIVPMRHAEVKHGRLAMLAAIAWPMQELIHPVLVKALTALRLPHHLLTVDGYTPSLLHGGLDAPEVTAQEAAQLLQAPWPGNVRQLVNVVEQCVALTSAPIIPEALVAQALVAEENALPSFNDARASFERGYLIKVLKITEGNVTQAARIAGRNRTDFYKLLSRHELEPASFKPGVASPSR